jgi:hypothetical protein
MAMDHAKAVMAMELNPEHKNFARLMSAKQSVLASVFTATARVREGLLRPSSDDGLDDILARIKGTRLPEDSGAIPPGGGLALGADTGGEVFGGAESGSDTSLVVVGDLGVEGLVTADDLFN